MTGTAARRQWLSPALAVAGIAMIPWLCAFAAWLPASARASHWDMAWTGLDGLEALGLLTTGLLLRRGDGRAGVAAAATAAVLLVDAWFDVTTAAPGGAELMAIAMAGCAELPMSGAVCGRGHPDPRSRAVPGPALSLGSWLSRWRSSAVPAIRARG